MTVTAVMGLQWGDEGKGKVVDYLAERADLVIRYQGGANAGHTVINPLGTFKLRLVPSGICYPHVRCLLGPGVAVDPGALLGEMSALQSRGIDTGKLLVAERATLVMPWHLALDRLEEEARGDHKIGTTLRGVGPAFTDKAGRRGLKVGDMLDKDWLAERVRIALASVNPLLEQVYEASAYDPDAVTEEYWRYRQALRPQIVDSLATVRTAVGAGARILLEGQLGVLRDPDWGTYPYVTSSSPLAGAATVGAGLAPWAITEVLAVAKAYATAVGEGPFPTEQSGPLGEYLRARGGEFGVNTGRPRRCGWFDAVAARYAAEVAGVTGLALTKLDVLDGLEELKICTGYRLGGTTLATMPMLPALARVEPVYETLPGWSGTCAGANSLSDLPEQAQRYVRRIEELTGVPVRILSVGPGRYETIAV